MAEKDLFAPPSKEELKDINEALFAPPDDEDLGLNNESSVVQKIIGALDYPLAPVRGIIGQSIKEIKEPSESPISNVVGAGIKPLVEGPTVAPTGLEIAKEIGLPQEIHPDYEKFLNQAVEHAKQEPSGLDGLLNRIKSMYELQAVAQSIPASTADVAGMAIENVAAIPGAKLAEGMIKAPGAVINAIAGQKESALKATGQLQKVLEQGLRRETRGTAKDIERMGEFAQKNVVSPFATTQKMLGKVQSKLDDLGQKLGSIRQKTAIAAENWLASLPGEKAVEFLENGFHVAGDAKTLKRIEGKLKGFKVASAGNKEKVMNIVKDELRAIKEQLHGNNPDIVELSDMKRRWQEEIMWNKPDSDMLNREIAHDLLQQEANRAIDYEINHVGQFLTNKNDLAQHSALKKEFSQYANTELGLIKKRAKEIAKESQGLPLKDAIKTPMSYTPIQSTMASIPDMNKLFGPIAKMAGGTTMLSPMVAPIREKTIEGYRESQTQQIIPEERVMFEDEIKASNLSKDEKAKRRNLLNKHGRVVIGP